MNRQPRGVPTGGRFAPGQRTEPDVRLGPSPTPDEGAAPSGLLRVRHASAPAPNSCRWCGRERGSHGLYYVRSVGNHHYAEPTARQRLARMRARRPRAEG